MRIISFSLAIIAMASVSVACQEVASSKSEPNQAVNSSEKSSSAHADFATKASRTYTDEAANAQAKIENTPAKSSENSPQDLFKHPIFIGISQICLPFIDTRTNDESLAIKTLAEEAGFKEGYLHDYSIPWGPHSPSFVYSTGSKDYGSEVEAMSSIDKKYCSSTVSNMTERYPSVTEFTQWLKRKNPEWKVIYDAALFVREEDMLNYEMVLYCNKVHGEYEQVLAYLGQRLKRTGPNGKIINHVSIHVEDVGKQKCSGYLNTHAPQK